MTTRIPSDVFDQGIPGNEFMPQFERITADAETTLKRGGVIVINSAGASCAVTIPSDVRIGSYYVVGTESVAGGNHTLTLPTGMLFDGVATKDVATFDAAHETLTFFVESATRATVVCNPAGITFS